MPKGTRGNSLLLEILLVVFFFLLSATVILNLFMTVQKESQAAESLTRAVTLAQNLAEDLRGSENTKEYLEKQAYLVGSDGMLSKTDQGMTIGVQLQTEEKAGGMLYGARIAVSRGKETVFEIPVRWYVKGKGEGT